MMEIKKSREEGTGRRLYDVYLHGLFHRSFYKPAKARRYARSLIRRGF
jgi:hypothetical protein